MIDGIYTSVEDKMEKALESAKLELGHIRTGKASPSLLDSVRVNYYGQTVPLTQVATINVPEVRLIVIQPWEAKIIGDIEKAILKADLGLNPVNDGRIIRLPIPSLTEERRREMVKVASKVSEQKKVAVRNIRRDANEEIKKAQKNGDISEDDARRGQTNIQELTDGYIKRVDALTKKKEAEIMEI